MLSEIVEFNPEYDRLMKISLREAERLSRLVDDFMQFAKPLQGKNEPLKPGLIIDEVIDLFLKDKKIDNKIRISRDLNQELWVQIDSGHLKQVILNILLNAAAVTPEAGTIYIRLYKKSRFVCISIKDEGPGIKAENRQLIFDPFFTTRQKGAGLGLSIAHRIVNAYNGNIELHNNKDYPGAEFIINLPEIARP
jgi:two-component system sensor histidine kinase PilS (NtrC family)